MASAAATPAALRVPSLVVCGSRLSAPPQEGCQCPAARARVKPALCEGVETWPRRACVVKSVSVMLKYATHGTPRHCCVRPGRSYHIVAELQEVAKINWYDVEIYGNVSDA